MRCKNGKSITLWLDQDTVKRLDKVANKAGISRSRLTENLVLVGLEEAEAMRKIGVLQMAVLLRDLKQRVGDKLNRVENLLGELA